MGTASDAVSMQTKLLLWDLPWLQSITHLSSFTPSLKSSMSISKPQSSSTRRLRPGKTRNVRKLVDDTILLHDDM